RVGGTPPARSWLWTGVSALQFRSCSHYRRTRLLVPTLHLNGEHDLRTKPQTDRRSTRGPERDAAARHEAVDAVRSREAGGVPREGSSSSEPGFHVVSMASARHIIRRLRRLHG